MISGFQTVLKLRLEGRLSSGHVIPFLPFISSLLNVCFQDIQAQVLTSPSPLLAIWSPKNYITSELVFFLNNR